MGSLAKLVFPYLVNGDRLEYDGRELETAIVIHYHAHPKKFSELLKGTMLFAHDFKREHTHYGDYIYHFTDIAKKRFCYSVESIMRNIDRLNKSGFLIIC